MEQILTVTNNINIADGVWRMALEGDTSEIVRPGQFVNISIDGFFLRRPISVCDWETPFDGDTGSLTLIYKVVGKGTEVMSRMQPGQKLNCLMGLGNGFDTSLSGKRPVLVGGGVGTPPMYGLAKKLVLQGKAVDVILGFNTAADAFYMDAFEALNDWYEFGCEGFTGPKPELRLHLATASGELGKKGFVTDCLEEVDSCSHYYACGPMPMLRALKPAMAKKFPGAKGSLSFEERMGCGFGACVGCSIETKSGFKKVCADGPVFESDDIEL